MSRKIVIVGASGFLGRSLCKNFRSENENNTIIEVHKSFYTVSSRKLSYSNIEQIDISNADLVYMLGWSGTVGKEERSNHTLQLQNVHNVLNWYSYSLTKQVGKFIYTGSVYELESIESLFYTDNPGTVAKTNIYGAAKIAATLFLAAMKEEALPLITVRIGNIYGTGGNSGRFLNWLIDSVSNNEDVVLSSGNQLYDFLYIEDASRALMMIGISNNSVDMYNLASGMPRPLKEYVCSVLDMLDINDKDSFFSEREVPDTLKFKHFDITDLTSDTGFIPHFTFKEGIKELIKDINGNN